MAGMAFVPRVVDTFTKPKARKKDIQIVRFYQEGVPMFKAMRYGIGSAMWEHPDRAYQKRWRDMESITPSMDLYTIQARVDAWRDDTGQNDQVVGYV